jgi:hypothetical protein
MQDGPRYLTESDINTLTTSKQTQYGAIGITGDGRRFRYVSFGGTSTIVAGQVMVAAALTANWQGVAITATGTGGQVAGNLGVVSGIAANQIVLTNTSSSTLTQDQFAEGFLEVMVGGASSATAQYSYKIKGNAAVSAGNVTTQYFTVTLYEPLRNTTALIPGTDTVNLVPSPYNTVAASSTAALPVGLTTLPIVNTASVTNYGWAQTYGPANVLNDAGGTITVGGSFAQSVTTAGSVVAATASTHPAIGITRIAISASNAGPAFLVMD